MEPADDIVIRCPAGEPHTGHRLVPGNGRKRHGRKTRVVCQSAEYRGLAEKGHEGLAQRLGQARGFKPKTSTPIWVERLGTQQAGTNKATGTREYLAQKDWDKVNSRSSCHKREAI